MPASKEMPDTIERSSRKAQRTWAKAHDSAVETYGEGERAHRVAFSALKAKHKKQGDKWVQKDSGSKSRSSGKSSSGGKSSSSGKRS